MSTSGSPAPSSFPAKRSRFTARLSKGRDFYPFAGFPVKQFREANLASTKCSEGRSF
jgi:hypothetical protein